MQRHERWRRGIERRLTLAEAGLLLLLARLALARIPFPSLMRFLARPRRQADVMGAERLHRRKQVRRALFAMRRRLGGTTCLHRAIAAQLMLRRRGVSTTLYFGAARMPTQGLTTHAWVQDGEEGVIGYREAQRGRYYVVASYPETEKPPTFQQLGDQHEQSRDDLNQRSESEGTTTPQARMGHTSL